MGNIIKQVKAGANSILDHNRTWAKNQLVQGVGVAKQYIASNSTNGVVQLHKYAFQPLIDAAPGFTESALLSLAFNYIESNIDLSKSASVINAQLDKLVVTASAKIDTARF